MLAVLLPQIVFPSIATTQCLLRSADTQFIRQGESSDGFIFQTHDGTCHYQIFRLEAQEISQRTPCDFCQIPPYL